MRFTITPQTLENHWLIYCDAAIKWWVQAFTDEATAVQENVAKVTLELENRKKENFRRFKSTVREITSGVSAAALKPSATGYKACNP